MLRLSSLLAVTLLVAFAVASPASPAAAQDAPPRARRALSLTPSVTETLRPATVVRRFVAEVDARDAQARPCAFLSRRLRSLIDSPAYLGRDPRFPDSYRRADEARACDVLVALTSGLADSGWRRTQLVRSEFVARHGNRVHLRATVVRRFGDRPRARRTVTDVFLLREERAWRIVSPALLWDLGLDDGAPRTFAELRVHLRTLARWDASNRGYERRLVRGYLTTRTPIAAVPLSWAGTESSAEDRSGDVADASGRRIADQAQTTVDLRGASLRGDGGTLTFELRFRGAVPRDATVEFSLGQGGGVPGTGRAPLLAETTWTASLHDGWASAFRGEAGEPAPVRGVRASAVGDTLRLSFDARRVRDDVRFDRPFRWGLTASATVHGDGALLDVWSDSLPERQELDSRIGVLHRP